MESNEINIGSLSSDDHVTGRIVKDKAEVEKRRFFLKGKNLGISVSECEDLHINGFAIQHLQDAVIEISRYVLAVGGNLVYGGDLRKGGFTYLLYNLVEEYKDFENTPDQRLYNYLAWPLNLKLTDSIRAEFRNKIRFIEVPPPKYLQIKEPEKFLPPDTVANRIAWADSLSAMRIEMQKVCNARIFLGGSSTNFKGRLPGVAEELLNAIQNQTPIYLAGAFGGMTKKICDLLQNNSDVEIVENNETNEEYFEFVKSYNEKVEQGNKINIAEYKRQIIEYGIDQIIATSGLNKQDYFQLMSERSLTKIVYLILRGLSNRISNGM